MHRSREKESNARGAMDQYRKILASKAVQSMVGDLHLPRAFDIMYHFATAKGSMGAALAFGATPSMAC